MAGETGLGAGVNYLPRVEPNEQRFQFADNATWTKGKHIFKFGVDIANSARLHLLHQSTLRHLHLSDRDQFALDFSRQHHWRQELADFLADLRQSGGGSTIRDYGFYAQDQWRVTPRLTVNDGVRYEYAQLPQPQAASIRIIRRPATSLPAP